MSKAAMDPAALTVEDAARLLTAAGREVTVEMVRLAVDAGAPTTTDPDGAGARINLVELMAWLEKELPSPRLRQPGMATR